MYVKRKKKINIVIKSITKVHKNIITNMKILQNIYSNKYFFFILNINFSSLMLYFQKNFLMVRLKSS